MITSSQRGEIMTATIPSIKTDRCGYSLIELSIVLVIVGLLIGGVLVGTTLINAAEIKALMSTADQYRTAYNAFQSRYNCIPGDCRKATSYFSGTQNGDGDGLISCQYHVGAPFCLAAINEHVEAIVQVQQAGLIKRDANNVDGIALAGLRQCHINYYGEDGPNNLYGGLYANYIRIYEPLSAAPWNEDCMLPEEAFNIDGKLDDGFASSGSVYGRRFNYTKPYTDCADEPFDSGAVAEGEYNLQNKEVVCSLFLII